MEYYKEFHKYYSCEKCNRKTNGKYRVSKLCQKCYKSRNQKTLGEFEEFKEIVTKEKEFIMKYQILKFKNRVDKGITY